MKVAWFAFDAKLSLTISEFSAGENESCRKRNLENRYCKRNMTRVKRGVTAHKRREKTLKYVKGFHWGRKSKERAAREALLHAWSYAFHGRKQKKSNFRRLWQTKIGSAAKNEGISYSKLIAALAKKNIALNRKILAELAEHHTEAFKEIIQKVK